MRRADYAKRGEQGIRKEDTQKSPDNSDGRESSGSSKGHTERKVPILDHLGVLAQELAKE